MIIDDNVKSSVVSQGSETRSGKNNRLAHVLQNVNFDNTKIDNPFLAHLLFVLLKFLFASCSESSDKNLAKKRS